jgi:hypothetical protein
VIAEKVVLVVGVQELETYLKDAEKTLIKIDVEGFEPTLISALAPLINKYHPDLLMEVLDITANRLNNIAALASYQKMLITSRGLHQASSLFASSDDRDWLLQFCEEPPAIP